MLPSVAGIKLMGKKVHLATISMWLTLRLNESIEGHCGYEFPWSPFRLIPFSGSSEHHNYHHSVNIGNYGSIF